MPQVLPQLPSYGRAIWQRRGKPSFFLLRKPSRQEKKPRSSFFFLSFGLHCRKKKSFNKRSLFIFRLFLRCSFVALKKNAPYLFSRRFRYRFTIFNKDRPKISASCFSLPPLFMRGKEKKMFRFTPPHSNSRETLTN